MRTIIIIIVIAGAFLIIRFCVQKNSQLEWLRISANRTFFILRHRIFLRNIFSIPAVLEMGAEVFRKDNIFVLRSQLLAVPKANCYAIVRIYLCG